MNHPVEPMITLPLFFTLLFFQIMWPLLYPEWYKRLDVKRTKGVLIHGPPGCGKTTLVRAMASMAGATFLSISAELSIRKSAISRKVFSKAQMRAVFPF